MNKQLIAILFFISALLLLGFSKKPKQPIELPETKPPAVQPEKLVLAWGDKDPKWDKVLIEEIKKYDWSTVEMPCKKISKESCVAQLISKSVEFESKFNPNTKFEECSSDKNKYSKAKYIAEKKKYCMMSNGEIVTSMGLLQISRDSANGYGCNVSQSKDLYSPDVNLRCGVKIFHKWGLKDKVLYGGKKDAWLGGSRYWSVLRCPKDSCNAIMDYMGKFK